MSPRREGFIIAVTLLVMLLLEVLAGGMLLVALHERVVATARNDVTTARARAETAIAREVGAWKHGEFHRMRVGEVRAIESDSTSVRIERLRGDLFLLAGTAPLRPGASSGGFGRAFLLLRAFDTQMLLQQLTGALVLAAPAQLLGDTRVAGALSTDCEWTGGPPAGVATTRPDMLTVGTAAEVAGLPPVLLDTFPREAAPRLAGLSLSEIAALADRTATGAITPAPALLNGNCDKGHPANWGTPLESEHPCADYVPFIYADGDLEIAGGAGQGLLVVTGNLVVRHGATFNGVIVAGGSVLIANATVRGAIYARSPSDPAVLLDASVLFEPCAINAALFSPPLLHRPLFPPGRIWLPAH